MGAIFWCFAPKTEETLLSPSWGYPLGPPPQSNFQRIPVRDACDAPEINAFFLFICCRCRQSFSIAGASGLRKYFLVLAEIYFLGQCKIIGADCENVSTVAATVCDSDTSASLSRPLPQFPLHVFAFGSQPWVPDSALNWATTPCTRATCESWRRR